jgi:3-hydroxyacyl-[acyl-carrier-protein] dehydratase
MGNFEPMSSYGIEFIKLCQKNRYPLLFIDEISDLVPGVSVKAKKNFTYNEWFFPSHFEGNPNVPGFVQLESLTQAFIMTFLTKDEFRGKETAFIAIENAKFRRKIIFK